MLAVLTAVLALLDAWIGLACQGVPRGLGLLGAALILAALAVAGRSRRLAAVLLVAGALPLPVATWWSLVTPVIAVGCLALGLPAVRQASARPAPRRRARSTAPLGQRHPPQPAASEAAHDRG